MNNKSYEEVKQKYGKYASWAIWDIPLEDYQTVSEKIKPNIVMVSLNAPGRIKEDFKNFHHGNGRGPDYKLRYTFEGTEFEGAYMTDIIKFNTEEANINCFREELNLIGSENPLIIALGGGVFDILSRNGFRRLIQIYHHSYHYNGYHDPEIYKQKVWETIKKQRQRLRQ